MPLASPEKSAYNAMIIFGKKYKRKESVMTMRENEDARGADATPVSWTLVFISSTFGPYCNGNV